MPLCNFQTNLSKDKISDDFHLQLSEVIGKALNKPESKITVIVQSDLQMCRGGTNDPTCALVIWSIGVFSAENNPKYAIPIRHLITEKLGIPEERIMLVFHDLKPEELAKPQ